MTTPAARPSRPDVVETAVTVLLGVAWSALPDHVASPSRRRTARTALVAAGAGIVAVRSATHSTRHTPMDDTAVAESAPVHEGVPSAAVAEDGPGVTGGNGAVRPWESIPPRWRPLVGVAGAATLVGGSVLSLRLSQRIDDVCAARLARAGVSYPYTVVGLGWGAVALVMALLDPDE
ncbi:hypothetical protein [Mobilicoccus pelagius]|nr:hypothetical protein [Mobilicoccus pelagius]